jgi:hypothetical protein
MGRIKDFIKATFLKEELNQFKAENKELINKEATNLLDELNKQKMGGWKSRFISDVYKERILYPHEEMKSAKKSYLYNSWVHAGADSFANLLLGGEIKVSSEDKLTEQWCNNTLNVTRLSRIMQDRLFDDLITPGNFYAERSYKAGKIIGYSYIPYPEDIYHELDDKGDVIGYVQEVPQEQLTGVQFKTINYYGDRKKTIKGIPIEKNNFQIFS